MHVDLPISDTDTTISKFMSTVLLTKTKPLDYRQYRSESNLIALFLLLDHIPHFFRAVEIIFGKSTKNCIDRYLSLMDLRFPYPIMLGQKVPKTCFSPNFLSI